MATPEELLEPHRERIAKLRADLEDARQARDAAIRVSRAAGYPVARIARAAGIKDRGQVYVILGEWHHAH